MSNIIVKYGRQFFPINGREWGPLEIELVAFREGFTVESGGLGRTQHFINCVKEEWPEFIWYEWAHEQAEALCSYAVTGFTAGANCSKSDLMQKYGQISWQSDPVRTLVIICSTSAKDAKGKVWAHTVRDFRQARAQGKSVGKLVESQAIIKLSETTDGQGAADNSAICLIAAGDAFKDDSLRRLQGMKNYRVILLLDELQDCSATIVESAIWNLSANPKFEIHAVGNAASRYDPHGIFLTPIEGWTTVNRTTHKWKIKVGLTEGIALHFDATSEDSPNMKRFLSGEPELSFLRKAEDSLSAKQLLGENNVRFLRQFVGFWPDSEQETNYLITEQEIVTHQASEKVYWKTAPTDFGGMDPSYSAGGDLFIFAWVQYGMSTHGVWTIFCKEAISVKVAPQPGETKDHAAVRQCKAVAAERQISPRNIGTDASAATSFTSILHREWSPEILAVPFGGAPTDLPVSAYDKRIASDIYCDRSTELLGVFHEFIINGQMRGMTPQHIKEATSRQFKWVGAKIRLESKMDMKKRLGYSPDCMDGMNVAIATIRERLRIQAGATAGAKGQPDRDWQKRVQKADIVSRSEDALREALANRY